VEGTEEVVSQRSVLDCATIFNVSNCLSLPQPNQTRRTENPKYLVTKWILISLFPTEIYFHGKSAPTFPVFREKQSSSTVEELSSQARDVGKMILNLPTLNATGGREGKKSMSQVDHGGCRRRRVTGTRNNHWPCLCSSQNLDAIFRISCMSVCD
jgi:hypothetical protein